MPSYLGKYRNSASNLEQKIIRAIDSVLAQTEQDFELIVISDGCEKTIEIVAPLVTEHYPKIRLLQIHKQKQWSGTVRNAGILNAKGDIIIYLDVDDFWGTEHLKIVKDNFQQYDWVYFNDLVYSKGLWKESKITLTKGNCGTSNIAHKRSLDVYWENNSYLHDYVMIQSLIEASSNYAQIANGQYYICHKPFPFYDI